ncbi:MAG: flavin reductase family protein [bacterium]|nr:flavin reductase family protein [bacterium]
MKEINIKDLDFNPFDLLTNWAVFASKKGEDCDAMTISWGAFGSLWEKYTTTIYIRPQRYTKKLLDENEYYTISFFDKEYKKDLGLLGAISKNDDKDKMGKVSFTKIEDDNILYFKEAKLVFVCKKLYVNQINKDGIKDNDVIDKMYSNNDFSYEYIGQIEKVLVRD